MVLLNHPSIVDGWFREISTQWPGQAMTLKVDKILHVEKSLYQDILVFESATFGNVLVLDGVIQCTERDEFSYQEMIAHLPLASHPNPEQVLVIGGGDGGVVREVLKHSSVTKVVLCEIDEVVPRVSRQYLPSMAAALSDPRVTIYIGDGFQFLSKHEGTYDVIITDSSDPVGPAESLFQKPYFQLLHNVLRPGGHVSTQGECLWVHLELITTLTRTMKDIFPVVEYAYTTIPSYPSGQIGFILCAKDPERNLRKPVRDVEGTKYYNSAIHAASFVLPEFGRAMLEEGKNTLPKFGRNLRKELEIGQASREERKILLLGSGYVAKPCAEYLARDPTNCLTIACRTLAKAQALAQYFSNAHAVSLDATDIPALEQAVAAHDLVIGLIPPIHEPAVIRAAIKGKTHVVMTSYVWPWMRALDEEARAAGIVILNEIGLDPGIDHLYAIKTIAEVHAKGGKVKHFLSYCGGLPAPECADNPLGYKFSWSARLMLSGLTSSASYLANGGQEVVIDGKDLMSHAKPYYISPAFAFMAYPNRNSKPFREWYGIPEAETVIRGTLRYQGFPAFIRALVKLGWFDDEKKDWLSEEAGLTWAQVMQKVIDAPSTDERDLINKARQICGFLSETESERIISGLRWLGLFSRTDRAIVRNGNLIDTLCGRLEALMQYEPGERDMIMLQHKFFVEWADGKTDVITATMERYGSAVPGGYSAMALTVGLPCAIAVQLILDGKLFNGSPGVYAPYDEEICAPLRKELEAEGIGFVERVL